MSYHPVAQNESSSDPLLTDETFANDRDKADATLHHIEQEHVARHLLQKQPLIRLGSDPASKILKPTNSSALGRGPQSPVKPTVSFSADVEKVFFSVIFIIILIENPFACNGKVYR